MIKTLGRLKKMKKWAALNGNLSGSSSMRKKRSNAREESIINIFSENNSIPTTDITGSLTRDKHSKTSRKEIDSETEFEKNRLIMESSLSELVRKRSPSQEKATLTVNDKHKSRDVNRTGSTQSMQIEEENDESTSVISESTELRVSNASIVKIIEDPPEETPNKTLTTKKK